MDQKKSNSVRFSKAELDEILGALVRVMFFIMRNNKMNADLNLFQALGKIQRVQKREL